MRYINIEEFCSHYGVEITLIQEFAEFGLVQLHVRDNREVLPDADITRLERMLRLFRDLGVNKEGIEVILNMREEIEQLRQEADQLRYRLQQLEAEKQQQLSHLPHARGFIIDYFDFE
jgi:DNA-binding transcriptional MerR regulator